ncbi:carbon starvation CstA family protein [Haloarchaeobius sp. DFWS5]|uniref:carbon starvation CstA family protein n=1 Tax=Haloarchaeobius sp. DFWS5 TaxID=3446114 RepID=UPI003EBE03D0
MVQVAWLLLGVLVMFSVGYLGYSRYLARFVELDESRETPAHKYEDGQEYVPAKKPVLLGHHYSSIAGGAPIVGPITAGIVWGWVPAVLWIAIGNPLLGSVHDFVSLSSSLRHEGKSIGYIIGQYVGERGKNMLLWFAFLTIILVVAVFALVTAVVFDAYPSAATASFLYILLALVFGVYLYQLDLPFIPGTIAFVAAVFASVYIGIQFPITLVAEGGSLPLLPVIINPNVSAWIPVILVYAFIASVMPVWMLLQPRDYLSSFLLYAGVGGALLAVFVGTLLGNTAEPLTTNIEPFYGFMGTAGLPLFPLLFVTIACGTISGFHSLVSSGTTAKQLNKETDARVIGYGGMLGEGLLATLALSTVAIAGVSEGSGIALALPNFASGGATILTAFGIPTDYGAPFMALVLVSFLLTSTDTAVRLGRYMFSEIVDSPGAATTTRSGAAGGSLLAQVGDVISNRYLNAALQCALGYVLLSSGTWESLWPLFGGANQLLAALALLTATVWLANWDDDKQLLSTGVPMALMVVVTIIALLYLAIKQNFLDKLMDATWMANNGTFAVASVVVQILVAFVLVGLALALVFIGGKNIMAARGDGSTPGRQSATPDDD